jgi:hypothetical protein
LSCWLLTLCSRGGAQCLQVRLIQEGKSQGLWESDISELDGRREGGTKGLGDRNEVLRILFLILRKFHFSVPSQKSKEMKSFI